MVDLTKNSAEEDSAKNYDDNGSSETMERVHINSRANRIAELKEGESFSESVRCDFNKTDKESTQRVKENLRNTLNKAMNNAAKRSGKKYTLESGEFFTRTYDIMITAVVTCL